jgi:large subunit ribosomal protein L5
MNRLLKKYREIAVPAMTKEFSYKNVMAVPRLSKIVINVGLGQALKDAKFLDIVENTLRKITGQKPVRKKAKKSISAFKIRKGMIVGMMVTLRREKMFSFLDKLINVTLPRVRDFRGISAKKFDGHGNLSLGFKENIAFPEVSAEEIERMHGLELVICTTAKSDTEAEALLRHLGFPFSKK